MWENAAPQSESQKPPPPRPACENGGDTLLWGQMLFCTVVLLVALAALAELQPVRTLSARTPARSISFLSFVISIPSSLFHHVRLSLYHKWRFDDETIVKFR